MEALLQQLKENLRTIRLYDHAVGLINFDFETIAPKAAREAEAEVMDYFANQRFCLANSERMQRLIVTLHEGRDELTDPLDVQLVDKLYERYQKTKNITPELDLKMNNVYSKAYRLWLEAKQKGDYSLFRDVFGEVLALQKQVMGLRENRLPDLYDNYLNDYEKGMLRATLDPFFAQLKEGLLALLARIRTSKHVIRRDFLTRPVPIHKQEAFSRYLLAQNGYDFDRGALTTTEHPFTSDIARNDARVTTHYYETQFLSNIYSVIHEGGHGILMQNERDTDYDHYINDYVSNGMHESVSRFYENVIGRSREYIHLIYPRFHALFADELGDVTERELYEAVNIVEPSLVRTEADEVTYGLHIIIRYELEKAICDGELGLDDVPCAWNELYRRYLGVEVPSPDVGVLQDVHWTGGFGYFPSYALGNCYNAMYWQRMRRELPVADLVREGKLDVIKQWMIDNVFAHVNVLDPAEWLQEVAGQSLTPAPFLDYLRAKYSDIYRLEN